MRNFAVAVSALALAAASGCGGGDDASTANSNADPTPTATQDSRESGTNGSEATATPEAGAGSTVDVAADPSGALAYEPTELTAKAGSVTIDFANETPVPHDVVVQKDGEDVGATEQITASTTKLTVELDAGSYTFYCSVPGHLEAGMKGSLTVN